MWSAVINKRRPFYGQTFNPFYWQRFYAPGHHHRINNSTNPGHHQKSKIPRTLVIMTESAQQMLLMHYGKYPPRIMWTRKRKELTESWHTMRTENILEIEDLCFLWDVNLDWVLNRAFIHSLTLMLLVANLVITKWCKNPEKWLKPWHKSTHLRVLGESYLMNTHMTGFRWFSKNIFVSLCFGQE